ncbi:SapC family protein [Magnetococcus sp. PR-3]|uniref:SapC family protein n=1 Tax=Magnetococcus sp. PR-3 TaxID=3120355 RepID=UPI002FCE0399
MTTQWPSPPGFGPVRPLDRVRHRGLGVKVGSYAFALTMPTVRLSLSEFFSACRDYPIVFARNATGQPLVPMVITGIKQNENIFISRKGNWRKPYYVPAYVRSHPFCLVRLKRGKTADGQPSHQRIVCVDEEMLESNDRPYIDYRGKDTPAWNYINKLLMEMEEMKPKGDRFIQALEEHKLLIEMHVGGGNETHVQMFRVDENRFHALTAELTHQWLKSGYLRLIHAHLLSLDNFNRLAQLRHKWLEKS